MVQVETSAGGDFSSRRSAASGAPGAKQGPGRSLVPVEPGSRASRPSLIDRRPNLLLLIGIAASAAWAIICMLYAQASLGWNNLFALLPHELGGFLAGVAAPIALLWMILAYAQRAADVRDITEPLQRQLDEIVQQDAESERRLRGFSRAIRSQSDLMVKALDEADNRVRTSRDLLARQTGEIDALSRRASGDIERIGANCAENAETVSRIGATINAQAVELESKTKSSVDLLTRHTRDALARTMTLVEALNTGVKNASAAADHASGQAGQISQLLQERVSELSGASSAAASRVQDLTGHFQTAEKTLMHSVETTREEAERLLGLTEERTRAIGRAGENLRRTTEMIGGELDKRISEASMVSTLATERSKEVRQALAGAVEDIVAATNRAATGAGEVRDSLKARTEEIAGLSGEVASHGEKVSNALQRQAELLSETSREAVGRLADAGAAMQMRVGELSGASETAITKLDSVGQTLISRRQEVEESVGAIGGRIEGIGEALSSQVATLTEASDRVHQQIGAASSIFAERSKMLDAETRAVFDKLTALGERFDGILPKTTEAADHIGDNLSRVADTLDQRFTQLKEGARIATVALRGAGAVFSEQVSDLSEKSNTAGLQLREVSTTIERQAADVQLVTEQAIARIDSVRRSIDGQSQEVATAAQKIGSRFEEISAAFSRQAEDATDRTERLAGRIAAISSEARREAREMSEAAVAASETAKERSIEVAGQTRALLSEAHKAVDDLGNTAGRLASLIEDLQGRTRSTVTELLGAGRKVNEQATSIIGARTSIVAEIGNLVTTLQGQMQAMTLAAKQTRDTLSTSSEAIGKQTSSLVDQSSSATTRLEESVSVFNRQASALSRASQEAVDRAQLVRESESRMQRDAFLTSAKFVLESLNSLAIDVNRLLDDATPERAWKSFYAGDTGVFTRRLLGLRDQVSIDKIRNKFEADATFRGYVQRYVSQFEEMIDHASKRDPGNLLSSTLMTSDVGKVYLLLCGAIGRNQGGSTGPKLQHSQGDGAA